MEKWNAISVMNFCIDHGFYTAGTNSEYAKMLNMVRSWKPTTENVWRIAKDIEEHSSVGWDVSQIYLALMKEVVRVA